MMSIEELYNKILNIVSNPNIHLKQSKSKIHDLFISNIKFILQEENLLLRFEQLSEIKLIYNLARMYGVVDKDESLIEQLSKSSMRQFHTLPSRFSDIDCQLSEQEFDSPQTVVKQYINNQSRIRMVVDGGSNYGNQAANANLLKILWQEGYAGVTELIYPSSVQQKVAHVLNIPERYLSNPYYYHEGLNIELIHYHLYVKRFALGQTIPVNLSLTAAADWYYPEDSFSPYILASSPHHTSDNLLERIPELSFAEEYFGNNLAQKNFANFFDANVFVQFSPYYSVNRMADTRIHLLNHRTIIRQENSRSTYLMAPRVTLAQLKQQIDTVADPLISYNRLTTIRSLVSAIESNDINFFPIYGYPLKSIPNLLNVIFGARYAQLNGPERFHHPLVIGMFSELDNGMRQSLARIIQKDEWGEFEHSSGRKEIRNHVLNLKLKQSFKMSTSETTFTKNPFKQLSKDSITFIELGKLPKTLFDGLYTHTGSNIWPQIREGASSLTSLLQTGKPHLHCGNKKRWEINFNKASKSLREELEKLNKVVCDQENELSFKPVNPQLIGEYIIKASNSSSNLAKYFRQLQKELQNPERDRIALGLYAAKKLKQLSIRQKEKALSSTLETTYLRFENNDEIETIPTEKSIIDTNKPCVCTQQSGPQKIKPILEEPILMTSSATQIKPWLRIPLKDLTSLVSSSINYIWSKLISSPTTLKSPQNSYIFSQKENSVQTKQKLISIPIKNSSSSSSSVDQFTVRSLDDVSIHSIANQTALAITLLRSGKNLYRLFNGQVAKEMTDEECESRQLREKEMAQYGKNVYAKIYFKLNNEELDTEKEIEKALKQLSKEDFLKLARLYDLNDDDREKEMDELPDDFQDAILDYAQCAYVIAKKDPKLKKFLRKTDCRWGFDTIVEEINPTLAPSY